MDYGTIKFFNVTKGFGFIKPENEGGEDLFVHISGLNADSFQNGELPNENDRVSYEVEDGQKGPMAVNVAKA